MHLKLHLPSSVTLRVVTFGMPRVSFCTAYMLLQSNDPISQIGNKEFADYVDAHIDLTHVNNRNDAIPILPGRFMGYEHPAGEVHITDSDWVRCPGEQLLVSMFLCKRLKV